MLLAEGAPLSFPPVQPNGHPLARDRAQTRQAVGEGEKPSYAVDSIRLILRTCCNFQASPGRSYVEHGLDLEAIGIDTSSGTSLVQGGVVAVAKVVETDSKKAADEIDEGSVSGLSRRP